MVTAKISGFYILIYCIFSNGVQYKSLNLSETQGKCKVEIIALPYQNAKKKCEISLSP